MAFAVLLTNGEDDERYRVITREAAARHEKEGLWDELYGEVASVYPGDALFADLNDMLHACDTIVGPGPMPAADWLIHLHHTPRAPPHGLDPEALTAFRAHRATPTQSIPSEATVVRDADKDTIAMNVDKFMQHASHQQQQSQFSF